MTHSSPSSSALVCRLATSEPAPGSENIWHHIVLAGDVVGEEALLLLVGAVLGEHRHAHAVADDELAVRHRVVALHLAPDLLVGEASCRRRRTRSAPAARRDRPRRPRRGTPSGRRGWGSARAANCSMKSTHFWRNSAASASVRSGVGVGHVSVLQVVARLVRIGSDLQLQYCMASYSMCPHRAP